jgi:multidrug efflux pump
LKGSREIGFTVLSMTVSLVAVFLPILLMGGLVGRLFREFAVTLTLAVTVSLLVSLSVTPMMCARLLKPEHGQRHGRFYRFGGWVVDSLRRLYGLTLRGVLRHPALTALLTLATVGVNVYLFVIVPKGFFPQQDTGRIVGSIQAEQDISFPAMQTKLATSRGWCWTTRGDERHRLHRRGGNTTNSGRMFIALKSHHERDLTVDQVITRLRGKLSRVPGASLFLQAVQDVRIGGRQSNAQYQYTLQSPNLDELNAFAPQMLGRLRNLPELRDVATDQQNRGLQAVVVIDRDIASRLGVPPRPSTTRLRRFGQRQVATIFTERNQYASCWRWAPTSSRARTRSPGSTSAPTPVRRCRSAPSPASLRARRRCW